MFGILVAIGVIILLTILMLLYRVYTLVSVARGTEKIQVSTSNKVNAFLFLLFLIGAGGLFFWYSFSAYDEYTQPNAALHGDEYESLFWATMWVAVGASLITNIALFFFSFRYQHRADKRALFYPDNTKLEIIWTIIPAIILVILVFGGFKVWNKMTDEPPKDAVVLEVMGYQFDFMIRYPGTDLELGDYDFRLIDAVNQMGLDLSDKATYDDFMPREIHIPKGVPVVVNIRARDVLHSLHFPQFRQKMDAMPGMPTRLWFVPTKTTAEMREELGDPDFNYELACAEICGRGHFSMRKIIVVDTPEDYAKWYAEQESWLKQNPDYLENVPKELLDAAAKAAGIEKEQPAKATAGMDLTQN